MSEPTASSLTLYSRTGCHLCEQAEAALLDLGLNFNRIEVSADPELEARYGWDVPVLTRDGETLAKGVMTRSRLARLGLVPH